ncbi:MAG: peptidoglycan-associated lipoprotein Pal [candidate division Zixibacteria bacterium]|nr:peptidoglycan-associated lipoprotein Pal [candidate division Zixibacteria bacterium]
MKVFKLTIIFVIVALLSFGAICGGKKKPTLTPPKPAETPQEEVVVQEAEKPTIEPYVEPEPEPLVLENIYFDFNKHALKGDARRILQSTAEKLLDRTDARIKIEGHCDERGTEQYNLALGEKRALEAKKFLISAGVNGSRIDILSYGEERPAVLGHSENAWSKNRRGEFKVIE